MGHRSFDYFMEIKAFEKERENFAAKIKLSPHQNEKKKN